MLISVLTFPGGPGGPGGNPPGKRPPGDNPPSKCITINRKGADQDQNMERLDYRIVVATLKLKCNWG